MAIEKFKNRIQGYTSEVEQWKIDHTIAMFCWDFELLLKQGLDFLDDVMYADDQWRAAVLEGKTEYDADYESYTQGFLASWLKTSKSALPVISRLENDGHTVNFADKFRTAIEEVEGILTPDDQFLASDHLANLRDEAIDSFHRGECETL